MQLCDFSMNLMKGLVQRNGAVGKVHPRVI